MAEDVGRHIPESRRISFYLLLYITDAWYQWGDAPVINAGSRDPAEHSCQRCLSDDRHLLKLGSNRGLQTAARFFSIIWRMQRSNAAVRVLPGESQHLKPLPAIEQRVPGLQNEQGFDRKGRVGKSWIRQKGPTRFSDCHSQTEWTRE
ncbi:hypothetical protein K438DRAFT_1095090 [Mycena galopus ATCC 62051]|nr:hypothetical protein K438DRAFT_1095090 [Mycena galopus ATCC 62051]